MNISWPPCHVAASQRCLGVYNAAQLDDWAASLSWTVDHHAATLQRPSVVCPVATAQSGSVDPALPTAQSGSVDPALQRPEGLPACISGRHLNTGGLIRDGMLIDSVWRCAGKCREVFYMPVDW